MKMKTLLYISITCLNLIGLNQLVAQTIEVQLTGADTVLQGEMLLLSIAVENASVQNFNLPEMVGLTVVAGPSQSSQVSIVNGKRSSLIKYTYRLLAEQPGLAFIPSIEVKIENDITLSAPEISRYIVEDINYIPKAPEDQNSEKQKRKSRPTIKM